MDFVSFGKLMHPNNCPPTPGLSEQSTDAEKWQVAGTGVFWMFRESVDSGGVGVIGGGGVTWDVPG